MVYGSRGDQGMTVVFRDEFRSVKVAGAGVGGYTGLFVKCEIEGRNITIPIRLSSSSSDFLTAETKWAKGVAAEITALLTKDVNRDGR